MDITFDWYTKLHHCFLLSWKSSKTLHEWFNVNLDVNSTWFELGFCYMNFAWNISFFKWNLYTCKSSKHGTIIKYIDSIGKKALNTLWMLFCCTSNSKINCKFNMNLLAKQLFDDVTSSPWDFWNMFWTDYQFYSSILYFMYFMYMWSMHKIFQNVPLYFYIKEYFSYNQCCVIHQFFL